MSWTCKTWRQSSSHRDDKGYLNGGRVYLPPGKEKNSVRGWSTCPNAVFLRREYHSSVFPRFWRGWKDTKVWEMLFPNKKADPGSSEALPFTQPPLLGWWAKVQRRKEKRWRWGMCISWLPTLWQIDLELYCVSLITTSPSYGLLRKD